MAERGGLEDPYGGTLSWDSNPTPSADSPGAGERGSSAEDGDDGGDGSPTPPLASGDPAPEPAAGPFAGFSLSAAPASSGLAGAAAWARPGERARMERSAPSRCASPRRRARRGRPDDGDAARRALEAPGLWAGQVVTGAGAVSGWHHDDSNTSMLYVVRGGLRLECEGVEGWVDAVAGDYVAGARVDRAPRVEPGREPSLAVIARAGVGIPTVNVDGRPAPAPLIGRRVSSPGAYRAAGGACGADTDSTQPHQGGWRTTPAAPWPTAPGDVLEEPLGRSSARPGRR